MSIDVTRDFIRNLTKGIRALYGNDPKHTEVLDLVAGALGWKADALMHRLKNDELRQPARVSEPPADIRTPTLNDWLVRRRWRERIQDREAMVAFLHEGDAADVQTEVMAELALAKAVFGEVSAAMEIIGARSPDNPYASLVWGVVMFMAKGDTVEARALVEAGISQDARLLEGFAVPREISERLVGGDRRMEIRKKDDWFKLHEITEHFPVDHVVEFVRDVAIAADLCLVRSVRKGEWEIRRNAGTGHFLEPAVPVSESVTDEGLVCLFDGEVRKMMSRHVKSHYGMDPDGYRRFWRLPETYPMVSPTYEREKEIFARQSGLGSKAERRLPK